MRMLAELVRMLAGAGGSGEGSNGRKSLFIRVAEDLKSQKMRIPQDLEILASAVQTTLQGGLVDDKKYLLEQVVKLAASLPPDTESSQQLTGQFIKTLWENLQHPPLSYLDDEFKYRKADGSSNDVNIVENSSYLDLSPLYGHSEADQATVRTFKDGYLKPDAFVEVRLLGFPPGVCALVVCFNRFHNYVVGQLAEINESGRFSLPAGVTPADKEGYEAAQRKRDNDLFQTARLITCGLYVNIILGDYVRTILNLNRTNSTWVLDPRGVFDNVFDMGGVPSGIGNQVSVEFNLIYRWHATVSERDDEWAQDFYKKLFPNKDPYTLSLPEFLEGLNAWVKGLDADPGRRTFGGLHRKADGRFEDSELVKIIQDSTEDVAGAFGARNVPVILKLVEVLGIEQARKWKVASLNEFRKFFGLQPHATFLDINSDPDIAKSLETLYSHPDSVELYPGLVSEEAKRPEAPGSGLCPGYTISKAILSDAVALVRGDRFYTVVRLSPLLPFRTRSIGDNDDLQDYNPKSLTNWGYNQASSNPQIAGGGVMYKLLMRAFPGFYRGNSVYAMFPFTVPDETRSILRSLGKEKDYDYGRPSFIPPPKPVLTWAGVVKVLGDQTRFKVPWGPHTYYLTGHDYMLSGDKPENAKQRAFVDHAVYGPSKGLDEIRQFYESLTRKLVLEQSHKLRRSYQLDIVRDVGNISHANFIGHMFHIPLKNSGSAIGVLTEQELYTILALLFAYVFLDLDTANSFGLRAAAEKGTKALGMIMKGVCEAVEAEKFVMLKEMLGISSTDPGLSDYGIHLIQRLFEGGKSVDEVVWTIIPTAAAAVATQAQGFAQMMELYLSDKYKSHWPEIQNLAESDSPEAFEKLKKYALEGYRLATPAFGLLRLVDVDAATIQDGPRTVSVKKGDQIFVNFVSAGVDPNKFPDPYEIKLDRPDESYIHHGWGPHACLGRPIVVTAMASQLRVFAKLKNLRRAPGLQGEMKSTLVAGAFRAYMKEDWSDWWPYPTSKPTPSERFFIVEVQG
ncbi:hypothetical protein GP486_005695 [Trichoglossum hirsutum]|uniref:Linoleate 8R-lipoxygenase n=1 Tax=Trichoglossum hirsutum TaxID=265104 RepID=A0A9P8L8P6_9PEZI|nr:hypothetical protein GP486_005695 [Trichoglossum hirsutum]